jgi:hypothetical protein
MGGVEGPARVVVLEVERLSALVTGRLLHVGNCAASLKIANRQFYVKILTALHIGNDNGLTNCANASIRMSWIENSF